MRRPVIAGNWKMNMTGQEAGRLALELKRLLASVEGPEVIIAPPFTALDEVNRQVKGSVIKLAGQNLYWKASGAFTGEISGPMLKAAGCEYVIVGHSERRQLFGETDATVNLRIKAALENGLTPIFCIGETLQERKAGKTWEVLTRQVMQGLAGVDVGVMPQIIVAYEPVWAIGTGQTATDEQAREAHAFLRSLFTESYPRYVAQAVRLLYGGSVKADNVDGLMAQADVDGVLVGGASLDAASFARIVQFQPVT
jgi:triosephosphate isomerase